MYCVFVVNGKWSEIKHFYCWNEKLSNNSFYIAAAAFNDLLLFFSLHYKNDYQ